MRTFTTEHTVYKFDELSEEAQDKAVENLYDINVDHDWWDGDVEWFNKNLLKPYGIEVSSISFDLDRGAWVDFDSVDITERVFLKKLGVDLRTKLARQLLYDGISVERSHYAGGVFTTYLNFETEDTAEAVNLQNMIDGAWRDLKAQMLKALRDEYDYHTSREAIVEAIEANEYEFYADGRLA
jgi:hypothetical protein